MTTGFRSRPGSRRSSGWVRPLGEAATRGLDSLVRGRPGRVEVREQAVFALSQRPADEGVPALIRIARVNPSPEIRKKALFWLGQSEDPRALTLFEEILVSPRGWRLDSPDGPPSLHIALPSSLAPLFPPAGVARRPRRWPSWPLVPIPCPPATPRSRTPPGSAAAASRSSLRWM